MLINNGQVFNLDSRVTPAILWGSLTPNADFNDANLVSAAVGTLYVSVASTASEDCEVTPLDATLWQKVADSRDACGGLSQSSDWKSFSFQFSTGTEAPNGTSETFCQMSAGSFYLQQGPTCQNLWLKAYGNCDDADWIDISSPGQCAVIGYGCPDETTLADQGLGTYYVDERSEGYIIYVKLADDQTGKDWWATNSLVAIHWGGSPEGDTSEELNCLPIGAVLYDYTITSFTSLWIKMENEQDGFDFRRLSSRPQLQLGTQVASAPGYTISYEDWQPVPNGAANKVISVPTGGNTYVEFNAHITFRNKSLGAADFGNYCTIQTIPQISVETGGYQNPTPSFNVHYDTLMADQPYLTVRLHGRFLTTGGTVRFDIYNFLTAENSATGAADVEVDGVTIHLYWDEES